MNSKPFHDFLPLRGKTVFLALETGAEEGGSDINREALQEAVVSLARAVFGRGGSLAMVAADPLLPLVLTVATEYWEPDFETRSEEAPRRPFVILANAGDALDEDELDLWTNTGLLNFQSDLQDIESAIQSLINRTDLLAMVCLGGTGRVFRSADLFGDIAHERPIFTIEATGGDARKIAHRENVVVEDRELLSELQRMREVGPLTERREPVEPSQFRAEAEVIPFPLLMQRLVARITGED